MVASILTTLFFALSAVFGRKTAEIYGSLGGNLRRLLVATASLGAIVLLVDADSFATAPFLWFLLSGIIGFGIGDVALFLAYPRLGSRLTMLVNLCLAPVFGAIGEFLWLGTKVTRPESIAAIVILTGVGLALLPRRGQSRHRHGFGSGVMLSVIAGFGQGIGAVVSRHAEVISQEISVEITGFSAAFQRIIGGLAIALIAWLAGRRLGSGNQSPGKARAKFSAVPWLLGAALFGPVIGVSCFQWALKETPSALVLAIVATTPIVLIPMAYVLESDRPTKKSLAGAVIAVGGVIWICLLRYS